MTRKTVTEEYVNDKLVKRTVVEEASYPNTYYWWQSAYPSTTPIYPTWTSSDSSIQLNGCYSTNV